MATDRSVYQVFYNIETQQLEGDTIVEIIADDLGSSLYLYFPNHKGFFDARRNSDTEFVLQKGASFDNYKAQLESGDSLSIEGELYVYTGFREPPTSSFVVNVQPKNIPVKPVIPLECYTDLEDSNFCLDGKQTTIVQNDTTAKFGGVVLTFFVNGEPIEVKYTIPFFNGKAKIDIGEKIQNYFSSDVPYLDIFEILNTGYIRCVIDCFSMNKERQEISRETLGEKLFYAGRKPLAYPLLTNHLMRSKIANSEVVLSYIVGKGATARGWGVLPSVSDGQENSIVALKVTGNEMIFPKVKEIENVKIITMQKPGNAINVQWINQNMALEWATFTGEFSISTDFSHSIGKGVFSDKKKKFETEKEKSLKLNTGFILKAEIPMIEELLESPLCYIDLGNRLLTCIPTMEKLANEDSTAQLINFELEFLIINEKWK